MEKNKKKRRFILEFNVCPFLTLFNRTVLLAFLTRDHPKQKIKGCIFTFKIILLKEI